MRNLSRTQLLAAVSALQLENTTLRKKKRANVNGGSGDIERGSWCTPLWLADLVGEWDFDPFSNPFSAIRAAEECMLEIGDDGLAGDRIGEYFLADRGRRFVADEDTRVWLQPPYSIVPQAISHYGHTRFCALLRFDPSTKWFSLLYQISQLVCVLRRRVDFVPPPGVSASTNPYPHALFYANADDAHPEVLRRSVAWRARR